MAKLNNMQFWYVSVMQGYKTLFQKRCLDINEANKLLKEKKEEFKDQPGIAVYKELF